MVTLCDPKEKEFDNNFCRPKNRDYAVMKSHNRTDLRCVPRLVSLVLLYQFFSDFSGATMVLAILPATTYSMHSRMLPLSIRRTYASPHTPLPLCLHSPFTARCQQRVKGLSGASSSRAAIKKSATTKLWLSTDRSNELSSVDTTFDGEQRVQEVGKYIDNDPVDITRSFEESSDDTDLNNGYRFSHNAARLEEVTDNMLDLDQHPPGSLSPDDIEMMAELMTMWSRRRSPTAAVTVEKLLKRVVDEMHAGSPHAAAETRMYVSCIDAWAKSGTSRAAATRAQSIHNKMVQTWKDASDPLLAPSTVSYNALMKAWGKCNEPDAPVMAEKVLTEMMAGSVHTKPDDVTFSTLLDAYAKSLTPTGASNGEAVFRCEELFYLMEAQLNIRPTVYTYSALQNVYVRSGMPDAALRAECTLHRMVEQYKLHGSVFAKPAAINYNGALRDFDLWIKVGHVSLFWPFFLPFFC